MIWNLFYKLVEAFLIKLKVPSPKTKHKGANSINSRVS